VVAEITPSPQGGAGAIDPRIRLLLSQRSVRSGGIFHWIARFWQRFHKAIHGLQLGEEGLQLVQGQGAWIITSSLIRFGMGLQKQAGQPDGHARSGQIQHLAAATAGGRATGITALQGMGDIEDQRQVIAAALVITGMPWVSLTA